MCVSMSVCICFYIYLCIYVYVWYVFMYMYVYVCVCVCACTGDSGGCFLALPGPKGRRWILVLLLLTLNRRRRGDSLDACVCGHNSLFSFPQRRGVIHRGCDQTWLCKYYHFAHDSGTHSVMSWRYSLSVHPDKVPGYGWGRC